VTLPHLLEVVVVATAAGGHKYAQSNETAPVSLVHAEPLSQYTHIGKIRKLTIRAIRG
jgi:hypothetical protein